MGNTSGIWILFYDDDRHNIWSDIGINDRPGAWCAVWPITIVPDVILKK